MLDRSSIQFDRRLCGRAAPKSDRLQRQRTFDYRDFSSALSTRTHDRKISPGGTGRPKGSDGTLLGMRCQGDQFVRSVIMKTGKRDKRRPGRHRTSIVVTAFWFVPRISALAVETEAYVLDRPQSVL